MLVQVTYADQLTPLALSGIHNDTIIHAMSHISKAILKLYTTIHVPFKCFTLTTSKFPLCLTTCEVCSTRPLKTLISPLLIVYAPFFQHH